jgi:quinol monooxygenase YgiN
MATILAHLRVKPGMEARFEEIARRLWAATHDHETGVRHYQYWRGADARTYYTLLAFDDHRTFIRHQTSEHHEAAAPDLGEVFESLRLEWVDPIAGASDLPPTEHQSAADGADALTAAYTERFAAAVAPWWTPLR